MLTKERNEITWGFNKRISSEQRIIWLKFTHKLVKMGFFLTFGVKF